MKTIHKFNLAVTDEQMIVMPKGAEVLAVGGQDSSGQMVQLWALVDPTNPPEDRFFSIAGTGNPFPDGLAADDHIGTVIALAGRLVWHVFERRAA